MKILLTLILGLLLSTSVFALEFEAVAYPDSNQVDVIATSVLDTVIVTMHTLSQTTVQDFFLTIHSDDSVFVVENLIDGNINLVYTTEVTNGNIYPTQLSTCLLMGTVSDSVVLKLYTANLETIHITFGGKQPFAVFGIVEPLLVTPSCCLGLRGNIDNDGQDVLDIADLVYLIEYAFGIPSGPAPVCMEEADVDATGAIDIADIIRIAYYMFSIEGNLPPADCP